MAAPLQIMTTLRLLNCSLSPLRTKSRLLFENLRHKTDWSVGDLNDPKYAYWKEKPHAEALTKFHPDFLSLVPVKGKPFEKLPFRILLQAGETYTFCTCGFSKNQPFCDGSHKKPYFISTRPHHIKYRPIPFKVDETKEYWLCMCKQSNNRPFCDGSHKQEESTQTAVVRP